MSWPEEEQRWLEGATVAELQAWRSRAVEAAYSAGYDAGHADGVSSGARVVAGMLERVDALDRLCAAYRLQVQPTERTLRDLERTREAADAAAEWLAR